MVVLTFELNFKKTSNSILQLIPFCSGLRFFRIIQCIILASLYMLLASLFRALFNGLLNRTVIFLLFKRFKLCQTICFRRIL